MWWMFVLLTLAYIPLLVLYGNGSAIDDGYFGVISQYTLGNIGSSKTMCVRMNLEVNNMVLQCSEGQISSIDHFGIYEAHSTAAMNHRCATDFTDPEQKPCLAISSTNHLLYTQKLKSCIGKKTCKMENMTDVLKNTGNKECAVRLSTTLYV